MSCKVSLRAEVPESFQFETNIELPAVTKNGVVICRGRSIPSPMCGSLLTYPGHKVPLKPTETDIMINIKHNISSARWIMVD